MPYLGFKKIVFSLFVAFYATSYCNIATNNFNNYQGLIHNNVRCFFEDKDNKIWIGTNGGISIYNGYQFNTITAKDGLVGNMVWSIVADSLGGIWAGSYNSGLTYIKNGFFTQYDEKNGFQNTLIRTLYYTNQTLLIGTDNGLYMYDYQNDNISLVNLPIESNNEKFQVMQFINIGNDLFVITRKNGIYNLNFDDNNDIILTKKIKDKTIFKLINYGNKFLYCAEDGIYLIDSLSDKSGLKINDNVVWDYTFSHNQDELFLASWNVVEPGGGLLRFRNDSIENVNEKLDIDTELLLACKFLNSKQIIVGTLDKGFYLIDYQIKDNVNLSIENAIGSFNIDNNSYYYNHNQIYDNNGNVIFSLNEEDLKNWSNQKKLIDDSYKEKTLKLNDLKTKSHKINNIQIYQSEIFISSTAGLIWLTNDFNLKKIFLIQIDNFHITDSTLIYQKPYHEFNVVKNIFSNYPSMKKLSVGPNTPTDIMQYQALKDSILLWTLTKGIYVLRNDSLEAPKKLDIELGYLKSISSYNKNVIFCTTTDDLFLGKVNKQGVELNKLKLPHFIKSIYDVGINNDYFFIHYNDGIYLSDGHNYRILNHHNFLIDLEIQKVFLSEKYIELSTSSHLIKLSLNDIFNYKITLPSVSFLKVQKEIPHHQNSVNFEIEIAALHKPENYQYYYTINAQDTIPIVDNRIYLNNLIAGNYQLKILSYNIFKDEWQILNSIEFLKHKAAWERWYFWIVACLVFFMIGMLVYYKRKEYANKQLIEQERVKKQLVKHKLEAIQAKMNPHFMFNSLNSIQNYIIDADTDNALLYLSEFSKLMRQTIEYASTNKISLAEEIDFVERYIRIEQMRFSNTIVLNKQIDISMKNIEVPPMILQPLIENAFIHGLDTNSSKAQVILLEVQKINDKQIKIIIANKKHSPKSTTQSHPSFGIASIEKRLKLVNAKNTLQVINTTTSFAVEIILFLNDK